MGLVQYHSLKEKEMNKQLTPAESWKNRDWVIAMTLVSLAIILRFVLLSDKPYHHDEAIFGMYAFYHFDAPQTNYYKYLPMLNGPLLFHLQVFFFKIFGTADWVPRLIPAILGSALVITPFFFRRFLKKELFFLALVIVGFSPLFIYYSRFLRHEYLVIWVYVLFMYFFCISKSPKRFFALAFLFWVHWCIKENVYVFVAILLGFIIFERLIAYFQKPSQAKNETLFTNFYIPRLPLEKYWGLGGFAAGFLLFFLLYSNYGVYIDGFQDGLYRTGFSYWLGQHALERIKGPFSIHLLMMGWYELATFTIILVALGVQVKQFYDKLHLKILLAIFALAFILCNFFATQLLEMPLYEDFLKLKIPLDIFLFFFLVLFSILHTFVLAQKNQTLHAFLAYLFCAHFFTYSYLGEKVPWLAMYPLFFGIILCVYVFQHSKFWEDLTSWRINQTISATWYLVMLLLIYNLVLGIRTSFIRSANIEEFIIQVHPVHAYKEALQNIIYTTNIKNNKANTHILLLEDATWITTWYFKDMRYPMSFDRNAKPLDYYDVVLSKENNLPLDATHVKRQVDYSGWWVPDYRKFTFLNYFSYAFSHVGWNESGLMKYYIYTRKGFYDP